jgi:hypothetical protein
MSLQPYVMCLRCACSFDIGEWTTQPKTEFRVSLQAPHLAPPKDAKNAMDDHDKRFLRVALEFVWDPEEDVVRCSRRLFVTPVKGTWLGVKDVEPGKVVATVPVARDGCVDLRPLVNLVFEELHAKFVALGVCKCGK